MDNDEVNKLIYETLFPTKESLIERFLQQDIPGVQVLNTRPLRQLLRRSRLILHKGNVCYEPEKVKSILLYKDENVLIKIYEGGIYMINRNLVEGS